MATIIPSVPITPDPAASLSGESKALLALKSLPDDYRVYHRKTWYSFDGGVREGEADLLLLHPELGMLVLEVKGGRVAFDGRAGTWTSTGRDGSVHEIKDPFAQAQRNIGPCREGRGVDGRGAGDAGVRSGKGSSSPTPTTSPGWTWGARPPSRPRFPSSRSGRTAGARRRSPSSSAR